jgi:hypothetical protein
MHRRILIFLLFLSIFITKKTFSISTEILEQQWKWANFDERNGLIRSAINNVYQAKNGDFWTVSDKGIFYYDHFKWNLVKSYNATDRFSNPGIIDEDKKGNLYTCFSDTFFIVNKHKIRKIIFSINKQNLFIEQGFFKSDSLYIKYKLKSDNFSRIGLIVNGRITDLWSGKN